MKKVVKQDAAKKNAGKGKILVAYYSRDGTTKRLAIELAVLLKAELDEILDKKNRRGALGYINAGRDASQKKLTEISFEKQPSAYDLVLIGTPIWAWTLTPAVRTYLTQNKGKLKKVAFFCTEGGSGHDNAFSEMEKLSLKPIACLAMRTVEVLRKESQDRINEFVKSVG